MLCGVVADLDTLEDEPPVAPPIELLGLVALDVAELDLAELETLELCTVDDTEADFVLVAEVLTGEDTEPVEDALELLAVEELPGALYGTDTDADDVDALDVLPTDDDVPEVLTGEDTEADVLDTTEVLPETDVALAVADEVEDWLAEL